MKWLDRLIEKEFYKRFPEKKKNYVSPLAPIIVTTKTVAPVNCMTELQLEERFLDDYRYLESVSNLAIDNLVKQLKAKDLIEFRYDHDYIRNTAVLRARITVVPLEGVVI